MIRLLHIALNIEAKPNFPMRNGIIDGIHCLYDEVDWYKEYCVSKKNLEEVITEKIKTFKPTVIFMQLQSEDIISTLFARYIRKKAYVVIWSGDVRNNIVWQEELAEHVGLTLFSNDHNTKQLQKKGLRSDYLQVGFDDKTYKWNPALKNFNYGEIVYLANNYKPNQHVNFPLSGLRSDMIHYMTATFGNNFKIYGEGWQNTRRLSPPEEVACYNSCKIAINLSHYDYSRYTSDRMFRIMASGAFCMTHRYKDIELDFKDGKHLICWDSIGDLVEKCKYWLKPENEEKRKKIAETGYKFVHSHHRWKNRFQELITIIKKHNPKTFHTMIKNDAWVADLKNIIPLPKVYAQFEEESIIGFIFNNIGVVNRYYVEFGAGNGKHLSNTALLKERYSWNGLQMDSDNGGNDDVKKEFITQENILQLFAKYNVPKEFDLLSIDIDGSDGYVLEEILSKYSIRLIVMEINGTIPLGISKTIKYNPAHVWGADDYYGLSISAAIKLGEKYGYKAIHQNNSTNLYLLRKDLLVNPDIAIDLQFRHSQYHPHNEVGEWVEY